MAPAQGLRASSRRKGVEEAGYSRFRRPRGEPKWKLPQARRCWPCACVPCVLYFYYTKYCPFYVLDCSPRLSSPSGSGSLPSPSSLSLSLPLLCLLPASLLLPLQAKPSLPSLWRLRAQLRQGLAGSSPRQNPIRSRTVSPTPSFSPGLGNTESVGAMQCGR